MADKYTSTTSMPAWAQPYAEGYLQRAQTVAEQPYQQYQGQRVAGFTPWQQQGLQAQAQRAADGSPLMDGASTALQGMYTQPQPGAAVNAAGPVTAQANPYAGASNPYLTQQIDAAQGDLTRNWNNVQAPAFDTAMSRSGGYGNANIAGAAGFAAGDLQRNLGRVAGDMRMQDYTKQQELAETAADRQMRADQFNSTMGEQFAGRQDSMATSGQARILQALGLAPSFAAADYADIDRLQQAGTAYQGQQQLELDSNLRTFEQSRDYPQRQLDIFGGALGQAVGNSSSTTQTQPDPSALGSAVGGALTFAQLMEMIGG